MEYTKSKMTITKMEVVVGSQCSNKYYADNYPTAPILQFTIKLDGFNDTHIETQLCKLDENKKLKNPISSGFTAGDGTRVLPKTAYELLKAIEVTLKPEDLEGWKALGFSKARFIDLPFEFEVGQGQTSDGGFFYILNTEYRKKRDADYRSENNAFDIGEFNSGKTQGIAITDELEKAVDNFTSEKKVKKESGPINPGVDLPW